MMASIKHNASDDNSFYIGDKEEGFRASGSVCDSDISLTDDESECESDSSSLWTSDESEISQDQSTKDALQLHEPCSKHVLPDEISFHLDNEHELDVRRCAMGNYMNERYAVGINNGHKCAKPCSDESTDTALTMACSAQDTLDDTLSHNCAQEYARSSFCIQTLDDDVFDIPVLTDACDRLCVDEIMAKASSMMVEDDGFRDCSHESESHNQRVNTSAHEMLSKAKKLMESSESYPEENYGFISKETLDKVLRNPVQLSASLTVMAHLSRRQKIVSRSHPSCLSDDAMPIIDL